MKSYIFMSVFVILTLAFASVVSALDVSYSITFNYQQNDIILNESVQKNVVCEDTCSYALPPFEQNLSEVTLLNITLTTSLPADKTTLSFKSTQTSTTADPYDIIVVKLPIELNRTVAIILNSTNTTELVQCTAAQCGEECVKCPDLSCHQPNYVCKEDFEVEKLVPKTFGLGEQQLNLLIKNIGDMSLQNVYAQISGYGIKTVRTIPIDSLAAGDKDYTFVVINASQAGQTDIIVKLYAHDIFKKQIVDQLTITALNVSNQLPIVDISVLREELNKSRTQFIKLQQLYQQKKQEGYTVDDIVASLQDTQDFLRDAQVALLEENYKDFRKKMDALSTDMALLAERLSAAQKPKKSWKELIQENIAWVGSIFGFIIAMSTVYGLSRNYLKKAKVEKVVNISKQIINVTKGKEKKK